MGDVGGKKMDELLHRWNELAYRVTSTVVNRLY